MKLESKRKLQKGRIYLKQGKWVVRYETRKMVKGGSPKQLGSYNTVTETIYVPIRKEDTENLLDPYSQGKEICFELFIINEIENGYKNQPPGMVGFVAQTTPVWYAKLWSTSKMAQDLQHYLETTPQEKIDEVWKKVKELDLVGPTAEEFLGINQNNMKRPFLLSHIDKTETCYKLVYAQTEEEAKSKLKDELDKMYLNLFGWENLQHYIDSETIF
jgi:hypothetical protein